MKWKDVMYVMEVENGWMLFDTTAAYKWLVRTYIRVHASIMCVIISM